tara:strand:+ start:9099 stop:9227 length:129 start_codon:yes stop_codon:yes gene_type:complete
MQKENIINKLIRFKDPIGNNISVVTVVYEDMYYTVDIKWGSE